MKAKKVWTIAFVALLALAAAVPFALGRDGAAQAQREENGAVRLLAVNVGKADSLLVFIEGKTYLVDTGTVQAWGALHTALKAMDITKLDGVFLTHTDKDHMGGMEMLSLSEIQVDAWYGSAMYTGIKPEKHQLPLAAARRNMQPVWLKAGDTVPVSDTSVFMVLGPITLDTENENNNSLVMVLATPHGNVLLTGDMEFEEEAAILASGSLPRCEVLKVSHHGEDDSTSLSFVQRVMPQVALISTNSFEEPDTPHPSVMATLKRTGAKIAITQNAKGGMLATLAQGKADVAAVEWGNVPGISGSLRLAGLDAQQDVLTIKNTGTEAISLAGWYVFSTRGEEIFFFPDNASLAPGATARLGSTETPGACDWRFDDKNVWHNKKKDEAMLYDPYGRVTDRLDNGLTEE